MCNILLTPKYGSSLIAFEALARSDFEQVHSTNFGKFLADKVSHVKCQKYFRKGSRVQASVCCFSNL